MSYLVQINKDEEGGTAPLIDDLEMAEIFKDEVEKEEASVMDFSN